MDSRIIKLAQLLTGYSVQVNKGEKVLIDYEGEATKPLVRQLIKEVYKQGGLPYITSRDSSIQREILLSATEDQLSSLNNQKLYEMKEMDCYIAIRGSENTAELSDVPSSQINMYLNALKPVLDYRVNNTKWVVLRYPNPSMAQLANMSLEGFSDFYFDVCTMDYKRMAYAMDSLVELMEKTDKVRIIQKDTDLTFSIKGMKAIKCSGERNIPDGEVYTAPIRDSVNGTIAFNTKSEEMGFTYEDIKFTFKDGKIVEATANDTEKINQLLDTDEGARYIGEFAIGLNPYVLEPMKDTLFDEKIAGSFHFTPGNCYEDADNGNKSSLHWDLVSIQRQEYGGGEIWFDDVLIRKDGLFVPDYLKCLNPENLK
ncbi:MAG: aminopeptidase [Anaerovoracaceae bacterium]|nr:aminopeptidase [Clostridiales bacterium]